MPSDNRRPAARQQTLDDVSFYVMPRTVSDPRWNEPGLLVLASLAGGPKHGYAMIQDVEATSGARLGPGTLYGAIARLEHRGLIEPFDEGDDRRRPYRITGRGSEVLARQLEDMARFVKMGSRRLKLSPA